jgi:hypothetical protein
MSAYWQLEAAQLVVSQQWRQAEAQLAELQPAAAALVDLPLPCAVELP